LLLPLIELLTVMHSALSFRCSSAVIDYKRHDDFDTNNNNIDNKLRLIFGWHLPVIELNLPCLAGASESPSIGNVHVCTSSPCRLKTLLPGNEEIAHNC